MKITFDKYVCDVCHREVVTARDEHPTGWIIVKRLAEHPADLCSVECHYKWAEALKEGEDEAVYAGSDCIVHWKGWEAGVPEDSQVSDIEAVDPSMT